MAGYLASLTCTQSPSAPPGPLLPLAWAPKPRGPSCGGHDFCQNWGRALDLPGPLLKGPNLRQRQSAQRRSPSVHGGTGLGMGQTGPGLCECLLSLFEKLGLRGRPRPLVLPSWGLFAKNIQK